MPNFIVSSSRWLASLRWAAGFWDSGAGTLLRPAVRCSDTASVVPRERLLAFQETSAEPSRFAPSGTRLARLIDPIRHTEADRRHPPKNGVGGYPLSGMPPTHWLACHPNRLSDWQPPLLHDVHQATRRRVARDVLILLGNRAVDHGVAALGVGAEDMAGMVVLNIPVLLDVTAPGVGLAGSRIG